LRDACCCGRFGRIDPTLIDNSPGGAMAVNPIPADYPRVMPYLAIDGASDAIEFYRAVLGANERVRMSAPDGKVGHAELQIGDSVVMLADVFPDAGNMSPPTLGGTPVTLMVYVDDVDKVFTAALEHGAKELRPVTDQFYGDRTGSFADPWGHQWHVASHVEDVPPDEMQRRAAAAMGG
jgi:PhnB protein